MRIIVFDLETRKGTDELSDNKEYAWSLLRAGEGGISAICLYDLLEDWLYLYDDNALSLRSAVNHIEAADLVVGFRSEGFDLPCLEGVLGRRMHLREHLDLYALIARTNAHRGIVGMRGDYTLDAICRRAFGRGKNDHGAHAPDLVKEGRYGELFNYCGNDVRLTRDLLLFIAEHGGIPNATGSFLPLHLSDGIRRALNVHPTQT